ncbi:SbcC/MukB-like Walker B domain-containing protein [Loigolactobacillus bifermentans]|uniref:Chromosome segregation ATPase n=1 Tax=Loigolactobacillus bifermentans DSM 20003 TaxID=1423726 RepID=A0A0R1H1Y0_9LACO|nr:SbcC/MukB-like Walker B domain-containing protein [Loigolactobacillus bifermentans]KRK40598.1 chromosome segregation ATPase [Loigolactobacillus bifermentans DSM 20003]
MSLKPVCFHLRNFNKYLSLDLPASENGNLTLIGENAVGKTTLANCFFPMLIDGSIATPSFNPAKGTERLDKQSKPKNSAQDTRHFENMLLSWGPGAMKVRTGYAYLTLESEQRQVILGLGASRGDHEATWWFVVLQPNVAAGLDLVTTKDGVSLNQADFETANQGLGDALHVFNQAVGYRDFVASQVYGFASGQQLTRLANVYRLLASPILTGGNAQFTPILAALRAAQAGIDTQVMTQVAASQRELNRRNGLLKRIETVQKRLAKMKQVIFWCNLNHLDELYLSDYQAQNTQYQALSTKLDQMMTAQTALQQQQTLTETSLQQATQQLAQLQVAKQQQDHLKEQQQAYQYRLEMAQAAIARFEKATAALAVAQQKLEQVQARLKRYQQQIANLLATRIKPLQAQISAQTAQLPELAQQLAEIDDQVMVTRLTDYLKQLQQALTDYQALKDTIVQLGLDVQIVDEMQTALAQRIQQRVQGPLVSRMREGLLADNSQVHATGKVKMNQAAAALQQQQQTLLAAHADLKYFLADQAQFKQLQTWVAALKDAFVQRTQLQTTLEQCATKLQSGQEQVAQIKDSMDPDFELATTQATIQQLQQQLAQLVIDPQLTQKLTQTQQQVTKLEQQRQTILVKVAEQKGQIAGTIAQLNALKQALFALQQRLQPAIKLLAHYQPDEVVLQDLAQLNAFTTSHRSAIRNHKYATISVRVGQLIRRNTAQGLDENAIDDLLMERGRTTDALQMRQESLQEQAELTVPTFDLQDLQTFMVADRQRIQKAFDQSEKTNEAAQTAYLGAAVGTISAQYRVIQTYNHMLTEGNRAQGIQLKIVLQPDKGLDPAVIEEACDMTLLERPTLQHEIQRRLQNLAQDMQVANDPAAFQNKAEELLDTRYWSNFQVLIKRRSSDAEDYEVVDDKFVRSGGSGAEKSQAMILPLLLVPKMILSQTQVKDVPCLVMFDEFADKLDPETAKIFAKTIANFGFSFIATMPGGTQNKLLADGVANIAYDVLPPAHEGDGRFHQNVVRPALIWQKEAPVDD